MKVKAIHEIHFMLEGKRQVAAPGTVVDLPKDILALFPADCYVAVEEVAESKPVKASAKPASKAASAEPESGVI